MAVETRVQPGGVRDSRSNAPQLDSRVFWSWVWNSVQPVLGWIFIGLGALLIVLAWIGVSRNAIVAKQLPYLASGGIGGIALVALGGRFMMIRDLRQDSGRLDRLEQMVLELHDVLLQRADTAGVPAAHSTDSHITDSPVPAQTTPSRASRTRQAADQRLFVLPSGNRFHRAGCRVLTNKSDVMEATAEVRRKRGLAPCPLCEPDAITS